MAILPYRFVKLPTSCKHCGVEGGGQHYVCDVINDHTVYYCCDNCFNKPNPPKQLEFNWEQLVTLEVAGSSPVALA